MCSFCFFPSCTFHFWQCHMVITKAAVTAAVGCKALKTPKGREPYSDHRNCSKSVKQIPSAFSSVISILCPPAERNQIPNFWQEGWEEKPQGTRQEQYSYGPQHQIAGEPLKEGKSREQPRQLLGSCVSYTSMDCILNTLSKLCGLSYWAEHWSGLAGHQLAYMLD